MRIVLRIARGVLVAAAATAGILLAVAFAPTLFGRESLIVTSGSMGKTAPVGSVVITRLIDTGTIVTGDIVSFRYPGKDNTITHRVIAVSEESGQRTFTTKGDANAAADPEPLRLASGRISRVEHVIPYAGHLVRYARGPIGGVLLFGVPILGLAFDGRHRSRRRRRAADSSSALAVHQPEVTEPLPHMAPPSHVHQSSSNFLQGAPGVSGAPVAFFALVPINFSDPQVRAMLARQLDECAPTTTPSAMPRIPFVGNPPAPSNGTNASLTNGKH